MKKHQTIEVEITERASVTKTIAYYEDHKILIDGGYVGQKALVKIQKMRPARWEATFVEAVEKADYEVTPDCVHFGKCGGCKFRDCSYEKQLEIKSDYVKGLFDKAQLPYESYEGITPSPIVSGYRNKMEYSFGDEVKGGELCLGMHEKGRHHNIVNLSECAISPASFVSILTAVREYFLEREVPFYNKFSKQGILRHLVIRKSFANKELMVNLVATSELKLNEEEFVNMLLALDIEEKIVSVLLTTNDAGSDAVVAQGVKLLYGQDYITENIHELGFKITPFSFFQTNSLGAEKLYDKVMEFAGDLSDKTVFDLYSGTGSIAQLAAKRANKVYGIEIVEEAVESAKINAEKNNLTNCHFICDDVAKAVATIGEKADLIILDPPRAGLSPKAVEEVLAYEPEVFVYVSCKATSLIDNLPSFLAAGYKITRVATVDMFPYTEHVETVCLLSRK
ncbi:MAG: 23S rRNA (uracil(1939)-C(5))-methyltransferase RlmD [Anaerofustis stercorihominis]|nr:23S rRNA (uracil(1939)-C(5))-methyltransferase RlmD [Anaerofustis stercorihominis]